MRVLWVLFSVKSVSNLVLLILYKLKVQLYEGDISIHKFLLLHITCIEYSVQVLYMYFTLQVWGQNIDENTIEHVYLPECNKYTDLR